MAAPASMQKRNGKYLWFSLLGLGFQPDSEIASIGKTNVNVKHINLGPNMFDKPNKDAFYIVTHFLLDKLNSTRFSESYRFCWPVLNHKADAEFRKVTCSWLREIMDESPNAGSKVVASLFLSPGGPKFTSLMLSLANHAMLQDMKTFRTEDSWVPEAAVAPASSPDMAAKRLELVRRRFVRTAAEQDRFLQEYQRRAQLLVKSAKDLRAEAAKYEQLLQRHADLSSRGGGASAEKVGQVRALWATVDGLICSVAAQREGVDSVLQGQVDQHVLDGTGRALEVPRRLQERVEQLPQLSSGRLYASGQLDLLSVLELLNHSLQVLREERRRLAPAPGHAHGPAPRADLRPAPLQDKCGQMSRALQSLQLIRQKISREGIPEVRSRIRELEAGWDRKWAAGLKESPLAAFLREEQAVGFLSPMAPLCFEPLAEAGPSLFSQFPAELPEEKRAEPKPQEVERRRSGLSRSGPEAAEVPGSAVAPETAPSQANTSLDWLFDTPPSPSLRAAAAQVGVKSGGGRRSETRILELESDNLAEQVGAMVSSGGGCWGSSPPPVCQFADAVVTPSEGRLRGLELEALLGTLHAHPFSTRKQLPRTPESLILEVKSSWRKAVEEDRAQKGGRQAAGDASREGRGDAQQLSLEQETLPELPGCDSLLSLDEDEDGDRDRDQDQDDCFLTRRATPHQPVQDWRRDSAEKVFSLDLDHLEAPSTPKTQEYVLPSLITFSPIDDMKC